MNKYTILLVEDDDHKADEVRLAVDAYFGHDNIKYTRVTDVTSAILLLQKQNFDLIILDMCFPENEFDYRLTSDAGFLVLDAMRRLKIDTPVILNTSTRLSESALMTKYPNVIGYICYELDNLFDAFATKLSKL